MTPQQQAVDKALEDRDRQWRRYRAAKRQQFADLYAIPIRGPLLQKFAAMLTHFGIEDGDRMVEYVQRQVRAWLGEAPADFRFAALQLISARVVKIRQKAGLADFDDPLPGDDLDVFQKCKRELGL